MPNADISSLKIYPADFFPGGSLAYLVGMNSYRFVRALDSPKNDCLGMEQVLQSGHGFTTTTLFDGERQDVLSLLEKIKQECQPGSRVVFYYAGHGIADGADDEQERPKGFLLAVDSERGKEDTYIEMGHVLEVLVGLPCSHLLIILDCCYAGAIRYAEQTRSIGSLVPKTLYAEKFSYYIGNPAKQVITSAACDQKAVDALGSRGALNANQRSPFAESLIRILEQGDENWNFGNIQPDGIITASEMGYFLGMEVSDRLSKNNVPFADQQTPSVFRIGDRSKGEFIFVSSQKSIVQLKPNPKENPWKGLADYSIKDNHLFYGRQRVLNGWWEGKTQYKGLLKLVSADQNIHKILVTGRSGSGKSSLVKAGVLARLEDESPGSVTIITPGNTPYSTHGNLLTQLKTKQGKVYLMVDQYEELVTVCNDPIEQTNFENSLAELSALPDAKVIITLRSDLERRFVASPFLIDKQGGDTYRFVVPAFSREEIREVVIQPAVQQLLEFRGRYTVGDTDGDPAKSQEQADERFVNRIIDETFANPDSLPLLSFALNRLFEVKSPLPGNLLLEKDYDDFGGISGILDKKLTDAFNAYDTGQQSLFRQLIYRMISFDAGYMAKRRVYTTYISGGKILNELEFTDAASTEAMSAIQQELVKQRLLKTSRENEATGTKDDNIYFEPAHEALLRSSTLISQWQNEAGGAFQGRIILLNAVSAAAKNYHFYDGKDKNGSLWKDDPRLGLLKRMWDSKELCLDKIEETFITGSLRARTRAKRILWTVVAVIITLLTTASVVTYLQKQRADENAETAIRQGNVAEGNYLISEAKSAAVTDPTLALRLAEEALKKNSSAGIVAAATKIYQDNSFYKIILQKNNEVKSVFFSPGDTSIVAILVNGEVSVRDLKGKIVRDFKLQYPDFTSTAFSKSGSSFLTGYADGTILFYNLNGNITGRLNFHNKRITAAAFGRGDSSIVTGYDDGKVFLSDLKLNKVKELKSDPLSVISINFSNDGNKILSADQEGRVFLCNLDGTPIKEFDTGQREIFDAAFSKDDRLILTSSPYDAILSDLEGTAVSTVVKIDDDGLPRIHSVTFLPNDDEKNILFGFEDVSAQIRNIDGKVIQEFKGHTGAVTSLAFSHNGTLLLTGSADYTVRLWQRPGIEITPDSNRRTIKDYAKAPGAFQINSVVCSPDGHSILTGSTNSEAHSLDLNSGQVQLYSGHTNAVMSVAYSVTGDSLLTGSSDSTTILYNLKGDILRKFNHKGVVTSVAFAPDGKTILTGSMDGTACIWDLKGNKIREIREPAGYVRYAAFLPAGQTILTSNDVLLNINGETEIKDTGYVSSAHLWDARGKQLQTFKLPPWVKHNDQGKMGIFSIAFSPNGKKVLFGTSSGRSFLWDIQDKKVQELGDENLDGVTSAAFSPDGQTIFVATEEGAGFLWDLHGNLIHLFTTGHISPNTVKFMPGGNRIITVSAGGYARIFDAPKSLPAFLKYGNFEQMSAEQKNKFGIK